MTTPAIPTTNPRDRLVADLKLVIADAEELLKLTAGQAGEKAAEVRKRIEQNLATARTELSRMQDQAIATAREGGEAADRYVRTNPWQAVGIAACAGLVLGVLIGRR